MDCRQAHEAEPLDFRDRLDFRDPEDRPVDKRDPSQIRDKMLDKTLADSFPASDPPSTDPAPEVDSFSKPAA